MRYLWGDLAKLLQRYRKRVSLLFVHLAEAHAEDEWPIGSPVQVLQHTQLQHRIAAAEQFFSALQLQSELVDCGVAMRMTVDTMDNAFHATYGSWPTQWFLATPRRDGASGAGGSHSDVSFRMEAVSNYDDPMLTLDDFAAHLYGRFGRGEDQVGGQSTALETVRGLPISAGAQGGERGSEGAPSAAAAGTMQ